MEVGALAMQNRVFDMGRDMLIHDSFAVSAKDISLAFGGHRVLREASFRFEQGSIVLLRGDNGAGKTTLMNIISGYIRPDTGRIELALKGAVHDASQTSPEKLAGFGVGRLWQDIRLFPTMSVLDNVLAATPRMLGLNPLVAIAAFPWVRKQEREALALARYNLALVGMGERADSSGERLSLGQMKRVALARLLQANADLLLLDEPLAGLDVESAASLINLIADLRKNEKKTIVLVEHQHQMVFDLCDETWFLCNGNLEKTVH
jgi:ABC-type branched-subunit amino acid transport system ATPase component